MDKLEILFQICEKENITHEFVDFKPTLLGLYVKHHDTYPVIGLNRSIQYDKLKMIEVLSEEVGHHFTSVGNHAVKLKNYRDKLDLNKSENKALKWACNHLISDDELIETALTTTDLHEMSDTLGVPHCMLLYKLNVLGLEKEFIVSKGGHTLFIGSCGSCLYFDD